MNWSVMNVVCYEGFAINRSVMNRHRSKQPTWPGVYRVFTFFKI